MLVFCDDHNKIIYIMAPKCGTTTVSHSLNVGLSNQSHKVSCFANLNNPQYKKIIIIRESIVDRFLSGFYEDLFSNTCYDEMEITFDNYLLFLHKCFRDKIPNVSNFNVYNGLDIPVWFGNCSNVTLNITDANGNFCSHIQSQKYAISEITNSINCKNVQIVELNNLSSILKDKRSYNVKPKMGTKPPGFNISILSLSYIKKKQFVISSDFLNEKQKEIILDILNEDIIFLRELKEKFGDALVGLH